METLIMEEQVIKITRSDTQKITPFLWFDKQAVHADRHNIKYEIIGHYAIIVVNSSFIAIPWLGLTIPFGSKASGRQKGSVMTVAFRIEGQEFVAINGGPLFRITPAVSFVVSCDTQEEIDYYWYKLSEGGDEKAQQCGWLSDKFGVSWQIVPAIWEEMIGKAGSEKSEKLMQAILTMKKIDLETIRKVYAAY